MTERQDELTSEGAHNGVTPESSEQRSKLVGSGANVELPDLVHSTSSIDAELAASESLRSYLTSWFRRVRSGESGILPVIIGLVVIVVIFQVREPVFLSAGNLVNLLIQSTVFMLLGMAEIFVLLLGEIDLSIGYVAGVGAVFTAYFVGPPDNLPWYVAILIGVIATAIIGVIQGVLITRLRLPSFIVTLAGLLGWEGVLIFLVNRMAPNSGGVIRITNPEINDLVSGNLTPVAGWIILAVSVAIYAVVLLRRSQRRVASGLTRPPLGLTLVKIGSAAVVGIVIVVLANTNRGILAPLVGMPWIVPFLLIVLVAWSLLLGRTRFGRYVYAIGGNAEGARRAGINVTRVRVLVFMLSGLTSGLAGLAYEARLGSISIGIDGGTLVLYAVAAAVIGGTSLFGGRGKPVHAVLGGLVIAVIYNGLGLMGVGSATQYIVTALVLLAAVTVDATLRRGATR
ncbi:MAG: sugar ABC transporter permease [Acidimicrobiales bacterium]